jgi:carbon storage regulator
MLVLSRKKGEAVVVGENVRITVLKSDRHGVKIGIEAPSGITILREELLLDAEDRSARAEWERDDAPLASSRR